MSEYTAEGTAFEGGACLACGAGSYGLLSDGPRCHGCKRFVLKDSGADGSLEGLTFTAPEPEPPAAPSYYPSWVSASRAALDDLVFDAPDNDRPRRWRKPKQWERRPAPLKTQDVLAEVDAILKDRTT